MIRADKAKTPKPTQRKSFRMKYMIQGPANKWVLGVERAEQASPDAGVQCAADALEQASCIGPGNIVEIARHDGGPALCFHFPRDKQNFGVALFGIPLRLWRSWMHAMEIN